MRHALVTRLVLVLAFVLLAASVVFAAVQA